ncbi:hypothetical protein LR68_00946 [Anoxybacillus sp. BCO1]|nr:hypothetical protein LR68_00946 [Anoxybacillus sp. BCO1]
MKKVVSLFLLVWLVAFSLLYVTKTIESSKGYGGNNTVTIYNWGDYIDPALIKKFEKRNRLESHLPNV